MLPQVRDRPINQISNALTFGLSGHPDFKVFDPVVVFHSVFVMHVFERFQWATKVLLHYVAMLQNCALFAVNRKTTGHIPVRRFVPCSLAFGHASVGARATAVPVFSVSGDAKFFAAAYAHAIFHYLGSFAEMLTRLGTVNPAVRMRCFGFKRFAAVFTGFDDRRSAHHHTIPFVNTAGHHGTPKWLVGALYQNLKSTQVVERI